MHVEDVPGIAQRCFAVLDTGVKVYLLSLEKLLASRTDLHAQPISALLFFRPLRLLVTAAKDGASKYMYMYMYLQCMYMYIHTL